MIRKHQSLVDAENVVNLILNCGDLDHAQGYVESYQNGREQGLMIWTPNYKTKAYYICHHRNGSEPMVYMGSYAMQSISDDAYEDGGKGFLTVQECADFIIANIEKEMKL